MRTVKITCARCLSDVMLKMLSFNEEGIVVHWCCNSCRVMSSSRIPYAEAFQNLPKN